MQRSRSDYQSSRFDAHQGGVSAKPHILCFSFFFSWSLSPSLSLLYFCSLACLNPYVYTKHIQQGTSVFLSRLLLFEQNTLSTRKSSLEMNLFISFIGLLQQIISVSTRASRDDYRHRCICRTIQ